MTAQKIAEDFIRTMNPENKTDGTANFAIYEEELPLDGFHLELCFIEENFDDGNESKYRTAIDIVADTGEGTEHYTFAETMTDTQAIADGIQYLLDRLGIK